MHSPGRERRAGPRSANPWPGKETETHPAHAERARRESRGLEGRLETRLQRHQVKTRDVIIGVDAGAFRAQARAAVRAFGGDLDAEIGRELLGHAGEPGVRPESGEA